MMLFNEKPAEQISVIPAKAGIQVDSGIIGKTWIPAVAGMTHKLTRLFFYQAGAL